MTDHDGAAAQPREEAELLGRLAASGIMQVDVSVMLGVGEPAISAWTNGHKRASPDNLQALRRLAEQAEAPPGTPNGVWPGTGPPDGCCRFSCAP